MEGHTDKNKVENTYSHRENSHSYPDRDFHRNMTKDPDIISMKEAISALTMKMDNILEQNFQRQKSQSCCKGNCH